MFQPGTPTGPQQVSVTGHYDVTEVERDQAVAFGAQAITPREEDKRERQRAAELETASGCKARQHLRLGVTSILRPYSGWVVPCSRHIEG